MSIWDSWHTKEQIRMKREIRILFYIWRLNNGKTAKAVFPLFLPFIVITVIFEFNLVSLFIFIVDVILMLLFWPFTIIGVKFLLCVLSTLKLIISTVLLLPFTISLVFSPVNCAPFIVTLSEDMIIVVLI